MSSNPRPKRLESLRSLLNFVLLGALADSGCGIRRNRIDNQLTEKEDQKE